jgi:hypothetical protein
MLKSVLKAFNQKPIVIYPVYVQLTGDHASAAALAQIMYWHGVAGGEFYKTDEELGKEICATPKQIKRIKAILHGMSFLKMELKNMPARTFYDVDLESLGNAITALSTNSSQSQMGQSSQSQMGQSSQSQMGQSSQSQMGQSSQSQMGQLEPSTLIYTESTAENTPENIYSNPEKKADKKQPMDNSESKKQPVDNSKNTISELLSSYGIEGDLAEDFIQHRKSKKGVLSKTVLNSITKEAQLAGISTAEAVEMMLLRNWQGFNHAWLDKNSGGNHASSSNGYPVQNQHGRKPTAIERVAAACEQAAGSQSYE